MNVGYDTYPTLACICVTSVLYKLGPHAFLTQLYYQPRNKPEYS